MKKKPSRKAKPSKALTKEQLVKLYEEFKEKKKEEYESRITEKITYSNIQVKLSLKQWLGYVGGKKRKIYYQEIRDALEMSIRDKYPYTEPTFNEFMESLKEEKSLIELQKDYKDYKEGLYDWYGALYQN